MNTRLFLPGPVEVPETVREAMARPMVGHRTNAFRKVAKEVFAGLKTLLGTDRPVAVLPCTGTGAMEGAVRTLAGGKVLHVSNGEYAKRWMTISVANGLDTEMMFVPRGRAPTGSDILRALDGLEGIDAVAVTHNETSTGALADLSGIGESLGKLDDTLVLVDAISSLGAVDIRPEEMGVDLLIASTQQALGLPPGAAIVWMSERAVRRAKEREGRGFFLDLVNWIDAAEADAVPSTPPIAHFFGLQASLTAIHEEGMAEREARHRRIAARVREWGSRFGVLAEEPFHSPTVTVLRKPEGFEYPKFAKALRKKGIAIGDGYGRLRDRTFRIGHMGNVTEEETEALIAAMEGILEG
ncbi:MAG: alanine--glyoxylate aminotransferase family protein [Planctomycetota bacterium]